MTNKKIAIGCFLLAVVFGAIALFTALFSGGMRGGAGADNAPAGNTYYISNDGSDENDGRSEETAFCTIGKLNSLALEAGDSVLFKRGDVFYNETFRVTGSGTQENPVCIGAYGTGDAPVIAARTTDEPCIYLDGNEGIEIRDLELAESYQGISVEYDLDLGNKYLCFENLYIRDMLRSYNSAPAEYNHTSCGITIRANREKGSAERIVLENLVVRNINFYNCEVGFWGCWKVGKEFVPAYDVGVIRNVFLENLYIERGNMWGFSFTFMENVVARNIVTRNTGLSPNNYGSCAALFGFSKNVLIEGLDIDGHFRNTAQKFDACGLDFEGGMENVTVRDSVIRNTDGCGIFITYNTEQSSYDFIFEDCTVANFGQNDGGSNQGCAVLVFDNDGHPNYGTGIFRNCTFINSRTKMTVPFYQNSSPYISFENCEMIYDTNWTYEFEGEGNTMSFEQYSSVESMTAEDGILKAELGEGKNYVATPDAIKIDAMEGRILKIRLKNQTSATQIRLSFIKDSDIQYDEEKSMTFAISAGDTDFKEYTVDLGECETWKSFVRQIRFEFVGASSGTVEIDSVLVQTEEA